MHVLVRTIFAEMSGTQDNLVAIEITSSFDYINLERFVICRENQLYLPLFFVEVSIVGEDAFVPFLDLVSEQDLPRSRLDERKCLSSDDKQIVFLVVESLVCMGIVVDALTFPDHFVKLYSVKDS